MGQDDTIFDKSFYPQSHPNQEILHLVNRNWQSTLLLKKYPHKAKIIKQELFVLGLKLQNLYLVMMAGGTLASCQLIAGDLTDAEKTIEQVLTYAQKRRHKLPETASLCWLGLCQIYYERNQLGQAQHYLTQARQIDPNPASSNTIISGGICQTQLHLANNETIAAQETIKMIRQMNLNHPSAIWTQQDIIAHEALVYLRSGDLTRAQQILAEIDNDSNPFVLQIKAECLLEEKRFAAAETILQALCSQYPFGFYKHSIIEARLLLCIVLYKQQKLALAKQHLIDVILFASKNGWVRPFIDHDKGLTPLLIWVLHHESLVQTSEQFAKHILQQLGQPFETQKILTIETLNQMTITTLVTQREKEVLRLLGTGFSNSQIAAKLYVSDHTIKSHLVSIYRKLGVANRTQAIAQALVAKLI